VVSLILPFCSLRMPMMCFSVSPIEDVQVPLSTSEKRGCMKAPVVTIMFRSGRPVCDQKPPELLTLGDHMRVSIKRRPCVALPAPESAIEQ
jgi:hypothetical protein